MDELKRVMIAFGKDESGATAGEYALLVAAVALLVFAGSVVLGDGIGTFFANLSDWFVATLLPAPL